MKKFIYTTFCLIFFFIGLSCAQEPSNSKLEWHTSLQEVHELSKTSGKPIFAFFTGSDWCGWCRKLQNDVFSKPEFVAWAKKNVILLELDFPRTKQLSPELTQQNAGMQQALHISGYPTVWLLYTNKDETANNFNLAPIGSLGYPSGATIGQEQVLFLENANRILQQAKTN